MQRVPMGTCTVDDAHLVVSLMHIILWLWLTDSPQWRTTPPLQLTTSFSLSYVASAWEDTSGSLITRIGLGVVACRKRAGRERAVAPHPPTSLPEPSLGQATDGPASRSHYRMFVMRTHCPAHLL